MFVQIIIIRADSIVTEGFSALCNSLDGLVSSRVNVRLRWKLNKGFVLEAIRSGQRE